MITIEKITFDFFDNNNLSYENKFKKYYEIFYEIFINNLNEINTNHKLYEVLKFFNEKEINIIYNLKVNMYMFFRYLPNIALIEKYIYQNITDSNAFHGITKNINISNMERTNLIKNILSKKNI
jgi:hypothetical protein